MNDNNEQGSKADPRNNGRRKGPASVPSRMLSENDENITGIGQKGLMFSNLIKVLHALIEFDNAFILQMQDDQSMQAVASTSARLRGTRWQTGAAFMRVLSGIPVSSVDINLVSEWASQPAIVREGVGSALHITLPGGRLAILVITHSRPGFFGPVHVRLMSKFAPLASQSLLSLDLQRAVIQRDRFFQLSMDLMGIVDYRGDFKQFNDSWKMVLGYRAEDFYRNHLFSFVHRDDVRLFTDAVRQLTRTGEQCLVEGRFRRANGSYCWLSCSLVAYPDEKLCYIVARDVTDRVLMEQQLAYDSRHDPLTGLYNRIEFMERLEIAFARSVREGNYTFAIFYMDLNGFKMVNDTLGHDIGDALLKEVSLCLLDVVREVDTVARFGGDEFTILLDGIKSREQMIIVIDRIHEKLCNPFILMDIPVKTSVSIGVTLSSPAYKSAAHMLRDADSAMYEAKTLKIIPYVLIEKSSNPGGVNRGRR
ncbi:MAG: sensor domain-containing diguanylate cyclase [Desulfocapsaceae bacterium]|nr:sensor domain-containing diguanylate cyclase [Desulfocapsaceae bacterium]